MSDIKPNPTNTSPPPTLPGEAPVKEQPIANDSKVSAGPAPGRDWQPVIVAVTGLVLVGVIVLIAVWKFPGTVPQGQTNTKGQNIVSVATAAITAVGTVIGAYFGVKSANSAREDTAQKLDTARTESLASLLRAHTEAQAAAKRSEIMVSTIVGKLPRTDAEEALQTADRRVKDAGL